MSTFVPAPTRSQYARTAEGSILGFEIIFALIRSQNVRIAEGYIPMFGTIIASKFSLRLINLFLSDHLQIPFLLFESRKILLVIKVYEILYPWPSNPY